MPRILVADDNTNIQKMVTLALQERGVEVTSVGNGEAAVRRLPDLNPDLILADIFMPVRNGYEVCEWVKKESKFAHIPVILLVGAFDPLDEKEARRVGADGILKKPFIPPDPLIAMVTSTLEKNPKLAAELAHAREAKEDKAAAPPVPAAPAAVAHEIPKKIELQPVPEFPEPSTDDASLAYGFGAGLRDIEDDGHDETAAARAPKSEFDKRSDEEFDGASTTSDWRRNAMSFEVPEEASRMPAFSTEEESEHARASDALSEGSEGIPAPPVIEQAGFENPPAIEASTIEVEPVEVESAVSEEQLQSFHSAVESGEDSAESQSEWASDEPDAPAADVQPESVIAEPVIADSEFAESQAAEADGFEATPETNQESPDAHVSAPEASAAKSSHWMDLMASASGQPQSDWLSLINAQSNGQSSAQSSAPPTIEPHEAEPVPGEQNSAPHNTEEPPATDSLSDLPALHASAEEVNRDSDSLPSYGSVVSETNAVPEKPEEEEWFFADEPTVNGSQSAEASAPTVADVTASQSEEATEAVQSSHAPIHEDSQLASASQETNSGEFEATLAEPMPVSPSHEDVEFFEEASVEPVASTEPDLVKPPAVHVTPEPLLMDEASQKPSDAYGRTDQEIAPAHEFLPQVESDAVSAAADTAPEAQPSPAETEIDLGEAVSACGEDSAAMMAEPAASDSASSTDGVEHNVEVPPSFGLNEAARNFIRPTAREQLAHIPFLNPPPHFEETSGEKVAVLNPASEAQAVETVVQRILDKIEPHLHDLLAQNLKPLIENLVHTELQKKDQ